MKFMCTGITGITKKRVFELLLNKLPKEKKLEVIHFEDLLKEMGNFDDLTLFLNSYNWQRQKRAWEETFDLVQDLADNSDADHVILCLHLIYFRNTRFFSIFSLKRLESFSPDGFLTLIDDIYSLRKRIDVRSQKSSFKTFLRLRDLLAWRSMETNLADILSSYLNKGKGINNYLLSIKQPIKTLNRLLFSETLKLYIAHPISSTRNDPKLIKEIEDFKEELHEKFTAFDPTTIDERLLNFSLQKQYPNWKNMEKGILVESVVNIDLDERWPIMHHPLLSDDTSNLFPLEISADEIVEVADDIDNLIQDRDYRLISQSDAVVAYRPYLGKKLSTGVYSEMQYARDIAFKPCYVYFPTADGLQERTPFKGRGFPFLRKENLINNLLNYEENR